MRSYLFVAAAFAASVASLAWAQQGAHGTSGNGTALPKEGGQAAFAAISEVIALLEADPRTDWSKVNIGTLRDHLVDMDNVILHARVDATNVPGGARFKISGNGPVRDSIGRMTQGHAGMADEVPGVRTVVQRTGDGAVMTVTSDDPAKTQKIRALGFVGAMTTGVHHQSHHLMMAKGELHH